jgi:hypothetical protein
MLRPSHSINLVRLCYLRLMSNGKGDDLLPLNLARLKHKTNLLLFDQALKFQHCWDRAPHLSYISRNHVFRVVNRWSILTSAHTWPMTEATGAQAALAKACGGEMPDIHQLYEAKDHVCR